MTKRVKQADAGMASDAQSNRKASSATKVGGKAATSRPNGLIASSSKGLRSIVTPAGFGALAMMVRPPPVTTPATSAYVALQEGW
jgi:hypothetical protein